MPRPVKNNADYFSHDNDMRNDERVLALRNEFNLNGYAIYAMLLEKLTKADFFELPYGDKAIKLMSGDFRCDAELTESVLTACIDLELIVLENNIIYSNGLKKRLAGVLAKRNTAKAGFLSQKLTETTQKKVKESKRKESILNTTTTIVPPKGETVKKGVRFIKPTLKDVQDYFAEKETTIDPVAFWNYYESRGWVKIKSWKHCLVTWEKRSSKNSGGKPAPTVVSPTAIYIGTYWAECEDMNIDTFIKFNGPMLSDLAEIYKDLQTFKNVVEYICKNRSPEVLSNITINTFRKNGSQYLAEYEGSVNNVGTRHRAFVPDTTNSDIDRKKAKHSFSKAEGKLLGGK